MPKKTEKGILWDFSTILSQNIKKIKGAFGEQKQSKKPFNAEKTGSVDRLEFFNIHFIAKHQDN